VVALEQAVAAPFATRQLADLGARVVKLERPGRGDFARDYDSAAGDGMSSWFVWLNRSKQSVITDLATSEGRRALAALIGRADVFVCNLAPATIRRLGISAAQLSARHPRLIACEISGYGDTGPYADRKAYDLLVQAEAGVLAVTGSPEAPAKAGISVADIAAGVYAYSGILAALLQRGRTGRGGVVQVSLLDALAEWMSHPLLFTSLTGRPPRRTGARHASIVPYGSYRTADSADILLAVQNEAEWARLCRDVLGLPAAADDSRLAGNERRMQRRDEVEAMVSQAVSRLAAEELVARLDRARIAYASVRDVAQVLAHPQLASRWASVAAGSREVRILRPPARHSGFDPVIGPVPRHGADTAAVLAEIAGDSEPGGEDWPDISGTYDVVAADYAAMFAAELAGKPFDRDLLDRFAATVTGRGPVWDVGCGPAGHVTRYLADRGAEMAGVDLSPVVAATAASRQPGLSFQVADMRELPARDASLAGIIAFYSVIHLPRAQIPRALAEFRRVLAPGGSLLLAMHGGAGQAGSAEWLGHQVPVRTTLVSMDELTALADAAGLRVTQWHAREPYPGEFPSRRLYLWATRPAGPDGG
jgi:itaconate CoA-transferase